VCECVCLYVFACFSYDDRWAKKAYNQKLRRHACADISRSTVEATVRVDLPQVSEVLSQHGQQSAQSTAFRATHTPSGEHEEDQLTTDNCIASVPTDPEHRAFELTPKRKRAIEAVRFIAAHLKNEDDYSEVSRFAHVTG